MTRPTNTALAAISALSSLSGWERLESHDQKAVQAETKALAEALIGFGFSKLSVGEHLTKIREVLEPKRMFISFLRRFNFSQRTAYRYIQGYENARQRLPEPVLKAAMARGYNVIGHTDDKPLGAYTDAIKRLPPPRTQDPAKISVYLDEVEEARRRSGQRRAKREKQAETEMVYDSDVLLKECYRFIDSRFKRLPHTKKVRSAWVERLIGMVLTDLGSSTAQSFSPVAVPQDFRAVRGRPRLHRDDENAA